LTEKLLKEETEYGLVSDSKLWMKNQAKLIAKHEFITSTANLLRGVSVEDQVATIQAFLKEAK
jgi:hypothetical protein